MEEEFFLKMCLVTADRCKSYNSFLIINLMSAEAPPMKFMSTTSQMPIQEEAQNSSVYVYDLVIGKHNRHNDKLAKRGYLSIHIFLG